MKQRLGVLVLAVLCSSAISRSQSPTAVVNGQVRDISGAAIARASVEVFNDATHVRYSTETNDEGIYSVPNLPPGTYHIQVSKPGFKTVVHPDIVLNVQDARAIGFTLPVGAISETVTIEGGAPLINTESAAVSTVVDRQFAENLPLNGRSFNTLLQLTPGVVIAPASYNAPGQFSVAGQRTDANNFTVDGVSANFGIMPGQGPSGGTGGAQAFSALGGTSSLVSVEALQEFRIETSSFAPEFGKMPGGQIVLTTRAGTNDFHGGVYNYFRNDVLDANDWFANSAGNPRAAERHNDFGGILGGPIWRDRTFFFFSYEGARLREPQTTVIQVPSEALRTSAPAGVAPFLAAFPKPNGPVSADGTSAQFTGTFSNAATLNATSVRIDHSFGPRLSIFGRYSYAPSQTADRVPNLANVNTTEVKTQTATVGLNMSLGSRTYNTVRANYAFQGAALTQSLDSFGGAVPVGIGQFLGSFASTDVLGGFLVLNGLFGGQFFIGPNSRNSTKQTNFADDITLTRGAHQLRFGGDYRGIFASFRKAGHDVFLLGPTVSFLTATDAALLLTSTSAPSRLLSQSLSLYGQDTWRVSPRLTLTYGLRWEISPAPAGLGSTTLASWTNVNSPAELALAPPGTSLWCTTYGNLAPRLGVAYKLTSKGDFVLRVGAGVFYDLGVGSAGLVAGSFPNSAFGPLGFAPLPITNVGPSLPVVSTQPPYPTAITAFAPDLKLPRSYQWNLALEKSFAEHQTISVTYVGQAGRDLLRQEALFQPNPNFIGSFLLTGNNTWSNYHALQVQYRRTLTRGLQALLNYTWSHSLDNASNDVVAGLSGTIISAANDYASSDFDVRHSFSGAVTYAIPVVAKSGLGSVLTKDWSVDTVVVARTGFPFNGMIRSASPDPGGSATSRPDLVHGQSLWISNATAAGGKSLNPAAFSIPSTLRQGAEGRNDIPGFGLTQVDFSLNRMFPITERVKLQFRGDAFNLFNHPNFTNPPATIESPAFLQSQQMLNQGLGGLNALFQEGGPRSLQLSLKLTF